MQLVKQLLTRRLFGALALLLLHGWVGAAPVAGTAITNVATATYVDSTTGINVRLTSNTVSTVVQPLEALTLTASQSVSRTPGGAFALPHVLTNTGNVGTGYAITIAAAGGSYTPANLSIVQDVNGNGIADAGEPVLGAGSVLTLAPRQVVNLLVTGVVPAATPLGQSAQFKLTATSTLQGATASNTDTVGVAGGPVVSVAKSASVAAAAPNASFSYTFTAQNTGTSSAAPVALTINGTAASYFIIRDAVPANTTFVALSSPTPGVHLLYHRAGDGAGAYVDAPPGATAVDGVAVAASELPAGGSVTAVLTVAVHANASGALSNVAYADYSNQGATATANSNRVTLPLPALAPTITFYTNASYATPATQTRLGDPLYTQINAAQCNTDPTIVLTHPVTLVSQRTGDSETFTATETGPNTGVFRIQPSVPTANAATHVVTSGNGTLEVLPNDHVTATLTGCGATAATAIVLVDPSGVVFDSKTNVPLAGAVVQLIDVAGAGNGGHPGAPAKVLGTDGVTPVPSTVTVGVDGSYAFPFVATSTYRLVVTPPNGYAFPSKLPPGLLPAGRTINATGSYGGTFSVITGGGPIMIDVPLDTAGAGGLFLQKVASKTIAQLGDFVDYTITINNNTGLNFSAAVLNDALPAGFFYVPGSARLNGRALTDPVGGIGPNLVFGVGAVAPGPLSMLTYRVHIGPGAASGSGVNTAQLVSATTRSNPVTARVQVTGGTLSDSAYLVGKVYADCNHNRVQDPDEPGIPGVRVFLDTGTYAITDIEGKYSLYGLTPRTHVAKVDTTTLPRGATLEVLANRNGGDPGSRFADLKNGELHKADFALAGCDADLSREIAQRRSAMKGVTSEITRLATEKVRVTAVPTSDARALPASGLIGAPATPAAGTGTTMSVSVPTGATAPAPAASVPVAAQAASPALALAASTAVRSASPAGTPRGATTQPVGVAPPAALPADAPPPRAPRFVNLRHGQTLTAPAATIRVEGARGQLLRLSVNGQRIDKARIEPSSGSQALTVWKFDAVALHPGANVLSARLVDARAHSSQPAQITIHYHPQPRVLASRTAVAGATAEPARLPVGPPPRPVAPRVHAATDSPPSVSVATAAARPRPHATARVGSGAAAAAGTAATPRAGRAHAMAAAAGATAPAATALAAAEVQPAAPGASAADGASDDATVAANRTGPGADPPLQDDPGSPGDDTPAGVQAEPHARAQQRPLAEILQTATPEAGFIDLIDGAVLGGDQARVRVKGPLDATLRLAVNGVQIPVSQVGEQSRLESRGVSAWEYVGVNLAAGINTLELTVVDGFGIVRASTSVRVTAPGPLARIELTAPAQAVADTGKPVTVVVRLLDAAGVPVTARTALTLEASLGEWQTPDLDPKEPGTQVFIEDGVASYELLPPSNPGRGRVRASTGGKLASSDIVFLPNLRPLIAAGIVEGAVGLRSGGTVLPGQGTDAFERAIQSANQSFADGKGSAAAAASVFVKGALPGSNLLTLSYDSDKPADTTLLRDIQPDRFYPVYGDSSIKGFDAQSTSKLYARVDHGTSYALFGDFNTQSDNPARLLTQYNRVLNGAKTHVEDGRYTLDAFAADTNTSQVIDEIPANGTSGPYRLSQLSGLINSQTVVLVTRDRNQPSIVLATQALTQFTDYAVEPELGEILFKAPVPSLDANLNPIYIRVTYEVQNGGPNYWVGGVEVRDRIAPMLTLGGTYVRDTNSANRQTLDGVNLLWQPSSATTLVGEFGQSQSDLTGTGQARRVELKHSDPALQARVYAVQTDPAFNNPNSTYTAGASEYGAKVGYSIDSSDRLVVDALRTTTSGALIQAPSSIPLVGLPATIAGGATQNGENIALEHSLAKDIKLTAGVRHVDANAIPTQPLAIGAVPNEFTSARVRIDVPVPEVPKAAAFAQYERALDDTGREATTVGGTYQLGPSSKLYATHETSDSLSGSYGLSTTQQNYSTVVGIDTSYMKDGQLFNEYRVGDGIDGRSNEAALELRNLWHLAPGLGLSTSLQQIHPISGVVTNQATALAAALEYTASPVWKGSTRVEWSTSTTAQTWLSSAAVAAKLDTSNTLLVRGIYNEEINTSPAAGGIHIGRIQAGVATRPVASDVWNALALIEYKRDANSTLGAGLSTDEKAYILSAHLNVQPSADWVINGRYGIKRATDLAAGITTTGNTQLVGARSVWDLDPKWDVGVQCYTELAPRSLGGRQLAAGVEAGYSVMKNVWVSLGYNVTGFRDADLAGEDYTQRSVYLRLRFKFDENLFRPSNNAVALPASARLPP